MLWLIIVIFGLSVWAPWIRWAVVPLLAGFLLLVMVRILGKGSGSATAPRARET
jgi:purine-cytosine permease-like protein